MDGKFGRTSTLNPSARDEACSGTVCSVVTVEIAHMGRMVSSLKPVKVCRSGVAGMAAGPMACRRCLRMQTGN